MTERIKYLEDKLKGVIKTHCEEIGCKNCPLKYENEDNNCSATDIQNKIWKEEMNIKSMNK